MTLMFREVMKTIDRLEDITLRDSPKIIDVGGHIGAFTKYEVAIPSDTHI